MGRHLVVGARASSRPHGRRSRRWVFATANNKRIAASSRRRRRRLVVVVVVAPSQQHREWWCCCCFLRARLGACNSLLAAARSPRRLRQLALQGLSATTASPRRRRVRFWPVDCLARRSRARPSRGVCLSVCGVLRRRIARVGLRPPIDGQLQHEARAHECETR